MGGSKTKTTQQQQSTATTQLPAWMTAAGQDNYNNAAAWMKANPTTAYTGDMTAGPAANQTSASQMAAATAGTGQSDLDAARGYTAAATGQPQMMVRGQQTGTATYDPTLQNGTGSVSADSVGTGTFDSAAAAKYMSPYTQAVQQNTLDQMSRQDAADQSSLADSAQAASAYGGARQALQASELSKNQEQQKQDYIDSSNQSAFTNAQGQFNTDQSRALSANQGNQSADLSAGTTNANLLAQMIAANQSASNQAASTNAAATNTTSAQNADRSLQAQTTNAGNQQSMLDRLLSAAGMAGQIGTSSSNLNTQQIGNLASTGAVDQNTMNAADQAAYNDYLRTQSQPLDQYNTLASILAGTPKNVTTTGSSNGTSTTKTSGGLLNDMMGLGQLGLSAYSTFSDRRLKRGAVLLGRRADGLGLYRYNYLWDAPDEPARAGVMADEVAKIVPHALGPKVGGFATVNYSQLGAF